MKIENEKTTKEYWESVNVVQPKLRLPSSLVVGTRNIQRILTTYITPQMNVLEIGFAPGKTLAWVAKILKAKVAGVDYSESGVIFSKKLFNTLNIDADLRCEDVFSTTFQPQSFDIVYSVGVIEHFEDPKPIVRQHMTLLKPGGTALILIPDYNGIYGKIQSYFDPNNLLIHNLDIMTCQTLVELAPADLTNEVVAFRAGRINPGLISFEKKWPLLLAKLTTYSINGLGILQPFDISAICPFLVLKLVRS
ncbi:MAG: class I SAM-dependent methyltransferase [Cyanobacteriota bacterium]